MTRNHPLVLLAILAVALGTSVANAQFPNLPGIPPIRGIPGPKLPKVNNKYRIFVRNNTGRPVWVAIHRLGHEAYERWWKTEGWKRLNPGEKAYLWDTRNRHVYFHAHDDRGRKWSGSRMKPVVNRAFKILYPQGNGRIPRDAYNVGFFHRDLGRLYVDYTLNLR